MAAIDDIISRHQREIENVRARLQTLRSERPVCGAFAIPEAGGLTSGLIDSHTRSLSELEAMVSSFKRMSVSQAEGRPD
jgi:hypothetical protein